MPLSIVMKEKAILFLLNHFDAIHANEHIFSPLVVVVVGIAKNLETRLRTRLLQFKINLTAHVVASLHWALVQEFI
jgi:hypothetical protein